VFSKLLIANRGEIAIRIARTAFEMGIATVALHSRDDAACAHIAAADAAVELPGRGAAAYLDIEAVIAAATALGCEAIHPGYGFLSENGAFARRCAESGFVFIGPRPEIIELYGDKLKARALAADCGISILSGTHAATTLEQAQAFFQALPPGGALMIKAVAGGGGRGIRAVTSAEQLPDAYARCQSEARRSFGNEAVYVERLVRRARHLEVQIVGDGVDVVHLWERECTLQRSNQKLVEIAPSPSLSERLRERLCAAASRMAARSGYNNLGTFEFLLDLDAGGGDFAFIEANPRIQVEHTITEQITGLDLVRLQLDLAAGRKLSELALRERAPRPFGHAIQLRVNMESLDREGRPRPSTGVLKTFIPPAGPGVRVDTFGYPGYATVPSFDSLLAKLIVWSEGDFASALARARRALREFRIEGQVTNLSLLQALLDRADVAANEVTTGFIEEHIGELLAAADPDSAGPAAGADGQLVRSPTQGTVARIAVAPGDRVQRGSELAVVEAMKMEHALCADCAGEVRAVLVQVGSLVAEAAPILVIAPADHAEEGTSPTQAADLDEIRADLAHLQDRVAQTGDAARGAAVASRTARGQRTARGNIADLCDPESFFEYGGLAVAYQYARRSLEELREKSPADGLVMGLASVNRGEFPADRAAIAVAAYDATVFAGTQGWINHQKLDRLLDVAYRRRLPFVLFAEGGGGRPGDDPVVVAGLHTPTFTHLARLSGRVPLVGIVSGRCFAGNAALLGCMDIIIATDNACIGMGGPAMVEGAGLGIFKPEELGPVAVHETNGVVDVRVADEAAAVAVARRSLAYFQGDLPIGEAVDQRLARAVVPENRLRAYDIRKAIEILVDTGSMLELRPRHARGMITGLARIAGRTVGIIANNPQHQAGAVEADGAAKAARIMTLCNTFALPLVVLIDTPGFMVGPESEKAALVRHAGDLFLAAARLRSPVFAVILRKAYGLGAQAMAAGHLHVPTFTVAWPTGELGGMGLEGAVRLAYKHDLAAIADPAARKAWFEARVADLYAKGEAIAIAERFELDAVIDPAHTRQWLIAGLEANAARRAHVPDAEGDSP
jgi:acetyl/propionyl-CoA carboxylase alpha subunit/acetyl-CoA carboxylase carboxyltransferase component